MKNAFATIFMIPFDFFGMGKAKDSQTDGGKAQVRDISPKQAKEIMDGSDPFILIDVRTRDEFQRVHIKGALNMPVDTIESGAQTGLPDKNALILVYCASGARSARASKMLAAMGYTNVNNFGGIMNWPYDTVSG